MNGRFLAHHFTVNISKFQLPPIGQRLKSAQREDFFYVAMLRYVSCFLSCQEGFYTVHKEYSNREQQYVDVESADT